MGDSRQKSPTIGGIPRQQPSGDTITPHAVLECSAKQVTLVRGASQEVAHTASRRSGPRRWLRAVEWLISAGLHPRANATTLAVARDLGTRMDFDTGHARYCLDKTAARLDTSRATVKRHVAYLRELGTLAWVQHGTRANIRRALGLGGYAGTATIYAAVIPPAYDDALGHRIIGTGYTARVVVDYQQMPDTRTPDTTTSPVDNASADPVDNPAERSCEPPSLTSANEESQVQMVGGFNYTPHAGRRTASLPHQTSNNDRCKRRTPLQAAWEIQETRLVRALVNWTQTEKLRRLAYVLRPFFDRGLDSTQVAAELNGMCLGWRPRQPANYIRTTLLNQARHDAGLAAHEEALASAADPMANTEWRAWAEQQHVMAQLAATAAGPRTDDDRRAARADWNNWPEVADHYTEDADDALDLYGARLCAYAVKQSARAQERQEAWV